MVSKGHLPFGGENHRSLEVQLREVHVPLVRIHAQEHLVGAGRLSEGLVLGAVLVESCIVTPRGKPLAYRESGQYVLWQHHET